MTASSKASSCARKLAHARITELDLAPALRDTRRRARRSRCSATTASCAMSAQPIAAVAAKDRKTALAAIAAIRIVSERAAVGDRARCRAQAGRARRVRKGQPQEGRQRLRRRRRAGALEGQRPRAVGGVLAQGEEGAELGRRRARGAKSAAGRRHLPHRHAIACLPRAARHRRPLRRRPPDRARLDAGGVPSDGADRQALQARRTTRCA